jgi:hypothetical protein
MCRFESVFADEWSNWSSVLERANKGVLLWSMQLCNICREVS